MVPTAVTAFLALCTCVLAAVACGIPHWSKWKTLAGVEGSAGIWDFPSTTYCNGWLIAVMTMVICTACFAFLALLVALAVLAQKLKYKTKPLRLVMCFLAFMAFICSILTICFYIAFHEWSPCWLNGSREHVNTAYEYTKYDTSFILACVACGLAMLMCLAACWSLAKTPRPPAVAAPMETEYVDYAAEYPVYEAYPSMQYAPAAYPAPAYPEAYPVAPTGYGYGY